MNKVIRFSFSKIVHFKVAQMPSVSTEYTVSGKIGQRLLDVLFDLKFEGVGNCGGEMLCGTCHCYLSNKILKGSEAKKYQEEDLLSLSPDLKENSRLACQLKITEEFEGETIVLPKPT